MPYLFGERIRLRAAEQTDISTFVRWVNDPEVTENLMLHFPISRSEEDNWYLDMLQKPAAEHVFVIEIKQEIKVGETNETWKAIGNIQFHDISWRVRKTEIGIMIGEKDQWNKGFGTEAMKVMCKFGFETLNFNRIWLQVYEKNLRGIRSYEKAGFKKEGRFRQGHYQYGQYFDILIMSILRSEWEEQQKG